MKTASPGPSPEPILFLFGALSCGKGGMEALNANLLAAVSESSNSLRSTVLVLNDRPTDTN